MRPLRPDLPADAGGPTRPLPPGAALWRSTAPRTAQGGTVRDLAPAPVWRSSRPPRGHANFTAAPDSRAETPPAQPQQIAAIWPATDAPSGAGDWPDTVAEAPAPWLPDPEAPTPRDAWTGAQASMTADLAAPAMERPWQDDPPPVRATPEPTAAPDPDEAPWAEIAAPDTPPVPRLRRVLARRVPRAQPATVDPAPSRIAYRLHRLWLRPVVRVFVRVGLPAWVLAMVVGGLAADAERRAWVGTQWEAVQSGLAKQPEFQVAGLSVTGASPTVEVAVRAMAPQDWPVSSFGLDLEALRAEIETLDAVARADLRVGVDRRLSITVTERVPAAVWRTGEELVLLDRDGHRTARLLAREGREDLPLLGGSGAAAAVPEALALMSAAAPLRRDIIGLVRVGERRWDVVLTGDRRILLPETGAVAALERVLAQDQAQELLSRDVVQVDMRLPGRPTVRMSGDAVAELRRIRAAAATMAASGNGQPTGGAMR